MSAVEKTFQKKLVLLITVSTVLLGFACLYLELRFKQHGVLMLVLVTFGTAFDFSLSILGSYLKNRKILLFLTRISFSLLNFGVVFTAMAAAFVIKDLPGCSLSLAMISFNPIFFSISIVTGVLFLFTKYVPNQKAEELYTLDRKHRFTLFAFILRRIVLAVSLVMALIVIFEGIRTPFALWSLTFGTLFIATIPLHILHKHMLSITAEFLTLAVLFYGTFLALAV